tara:strand:+ start:3427 stop:4206 length:780 start_codon:yes stop_codon:yes gene_type:complete
LSNLYIAKFYLLLITIFFVTNLQAQFFNKEVIAKIKVEKNSEFLSFTATAENITPSDYNLRYDFMVFNTEKNGEVTKENVEDRFFIKANEKLLFSTITINYSVEGKIILVLLLYDRDDKPIGQDRIVLENGGKSDVEALIQKPNQNLLSQDQAAPQDGFVIGGLVTENTLTKAGRDFYRYFYNEYYNKQIKTTKNIEIEEVPGRFRNTRISVKVADQLVWQFFAQPKKSFLKEMADIAFNRSLAYLQQLEKQKDTFIHY